MRRRLQAIVLVTIVVFGVTVCTLVVLPSFLNPRNQTVDQSGFVIRYVWTERHSDETNYLFMDSLIIMSNGSSWHDIIIGAVEPPNYHTNHSAVVSTKLSSKVYRMLEDEGFFELKDCYPDSSLTRESVSQSVDLTIESPGQQKTVTFASNAMIGILPKSYTILGNVLCAVDQESKDLLDLSLEVSASLSSDSSVVTISGTFANYGDKVIEGMCGSSPFLVTIVRSDGCVVGEFPEFSMADGWFSFPPFTETDLCDYSWNISGLGSGVYVIEGCVAGGNGGVCSFTTFHIQGNIR